MKKIINSMGLALSVVSILLLFGLGVSYYPIITTFIFIFSVFSCAFYFALY